MLFKKVALIPFTLLALSSCGSLDNDTNLKYKNYDYFPEMIEFQSVGEVATISILNIDNLPIFSWDLSNEEPLSLVILNNYQIQLTVIDEFKEDITLFFRNLSADENKQCVCKFIDNNV